MIEIKNINKSFGDNNVLKNISFKFEKGKTNLIIGESGSGKTTLLRILIGLHDIDNGEVLYDGRDFTRLNTKDKRKLRQEIGVLFQKGALYAYMSVEENIMFPLTMFTNQSYEEKLQRVNDCLERVNLKNNNHLSVSELSGGMVKRVSIARAMVNDPDLILADEPTGNLDSEISKEILELFERMNQQGKTIVLATHSAEILREKQYRRISLKKGKLLQFDENEFINTKNS